ncbi:MAG: ABC-F family ATP-binding cassette domain-containing protein [Deinococcaceae bacterium]
MQVILTHVSHWYGHHTILNDINWKLISGQSIALIGRNGVGKSTLLRIIAGVQKPSAGSVRTDGVVAFLGPYTPTATPISEFLWPDILGAIRQQFSDAQQKLEKAKHPTEPDLLAFSEAEEQFRVHGGYAVNAHIQTVLSDLYLPENQPMDQLSGGQLHRVLMAKLQAIQSTFYLLDEPTNHLDEHARAHLIQWILEMKQQGTGFVIASHDRGLINTCCTSCAELDRGTLSMYTGGLDEAMSEKERRIETAWKHHTQQTEQRQKLIRESQHLASKGRSAGSFNSKRMRDNDKTAAHARAEQASFSYNKRAKALRVRLERQPIPEKPFERRKKLSIPLLVTPKMTQDILQVRELCFQYGDHVLFDRFSCDISFGERVALSGPNGIGKSTLFRILMGQLEPLRGSVHWGKTLSVHHSDQERKTFDAHWRLEAALQRIAPLRNEEMLFLLSQMDLPRDLERPIHQLSSGQRTRLSLLQLGLCKADVLLLDEPTNHLDVESIDILERFLVDFPGTVLFSSHDTKFRNKVATRTILLSAPNVPIPAHSGLP